MIVKIAPIGEVVTEVNTENGTTVRSALELAKVSDGGRSIFVNDVPAQLDTPITEAGSIIVLANKMKGGK